MRFSGAPPVIGMATVATLPAQLAPEDASSSTNSRALI